MAINFDLPAELRELQLSVRRMALEKVRPIAQELDAKEEYPEHLFRLFA